MTCKPRQRDIVILDFEPSKGYEVTKRCPALVLSKNTYNSATNLIIVCPITTSDKERPFLVPIQSEKLKASNNKISKVNTLQVFSLDYTETANRNVKYVDTLDEEIFLMLHRDFSKTFLSLFNLSSLVRKVIFCFFSTGNQKKETPKRLLKVI